METIFNFYSLIFAWNEFATKIQQKRKETYFLLFFCEATILQCFYNAFETVQKWSTCNETLSKRYRNGPLATKHFRNGTEMVHLQRNTFEMVQKWSTCNETLSKLYRNGPLATKHFRNTSFFFLILFCDIAKAFDRTSHKGTRDKWPPSKLV
jgi:hypothetical protein